MSVGLRWRRFKGFDSCFFLDADYCLVTVVADANNMFGVPVREIRRLEVKPCEGLVPLLLWISPTVLFRAQIEGGTEYRRGSWP